MIRAVSDEEWNTVRKDPVFWMAVTAAVMTAAMVCCNLFLLPELSGPVVEYTLSRPAEEEPSRRRADINSATAYDLEQIEGIGPATSQKILDYIAGHSPVTDMDELLEVDGIGEAKLKRLKYYFTAGAE